MATDNPDLRIRLRGAGETDRTARARRLKVIRIADKMAKALNRKVSEAEGIRLAIDLFDVDAFISKYKD